ncbi:MAG: AAC(3) family N-acetyltransferase [Chlorobi bacterium]|nr:AAC(3) family N-acetyltransferase [Chlorobiota bacterium]
MNKEEIISYLSKEWKRCGINKGDVLLVHSSLKRLINEVKNRKNIVITPHIVYDSLINSLGSNGTLILPLFNFDFPKTKTFDIINTPSHMGMLTEIARLDKSSIRTGHPIYSFAVIGKKSNEFANIDNYSGYGKDSPFAKIKELNGKIAIIGLSDQRSMTSYHFVEEQKQVEYRYYKEFTGDYFDKTGNKNKKTYALYVRNLEKGITTDVNRMMDYLWENGFYKGDKFDEGLGMRTIKFNDFYNEVEKKIEEGNAINFIYSIKKE